jgi:hypothetical protein
MLPVLGRPLAGPTPCAVTGTRVVATLERCRRTMQRLMRPGKVRALSTTYPPKGTCLPYQSSSY